MKHLAPMSGIQAVASHAAEHVFEKRPKFSRQKYKESFARVRWFVETKQVPESKNTSRSKTRPRMQNTSQNPKPHTRIQNNFEFWDVFNPTW